jgi:hypothetical protein
MQLIDGLSFLDLQILITLWYLQTLLMSLGADRIYRKLERNDFAVFFYRCVIKQDKQRSTNPTHKTKYRVTRTSLKTGGEL